MNKLTTKIAGLILLCLCAHALDAPASAQDTREERPVRTGRRPAAPPKGPGALTTSTKKFDLDLFEANLKKAFDGKATGYAYAINQNGQLKRSGANGYAILARDVNGILTDPKGVKHHAQLRMNIASVSKPVTAVTVLRLLQENKVPGHPNLTINSKVAPFLPSTWKLGPKVADLTFKELLSQYSGMWIVPGGSTSTESLKSFIANGVTRAKDDYEYINANLAIFRIIIPYMTLSQRLRDNYSELYSTDPAKFDELTSAKYVETVNQKTLAPMGIAAASMMGNTAFGNTIEPRMYIVPDNDAAGKLAGDWTKTGGGGGWNLSAIELAQFLAHVRYNDKILSPATRKLMDENYLGWMDPAEWDLNREHGAYLGHRGDLNWKDANKVKVAGMTSLILNFPNGVQVSLLVNSLGTYASTHKAVAGAFDDAWK
jgi:CubicO group peptidase (beta-lactamase class C family)